MRPAGQARARAGPRTPRRSRVDAGLDSRRDPTRAQQVGSQFLSACGRCAFDEARGRRAKRPGGLHAFEVLGRELLGVLSDTARLLTHFAVLIQDATQFVEFSVFMGKRLLRRRC